MRHKIGGTLVLVGFLTLFGFGRLDWLGAVLVAAILIASLAGCSANHDGKLTKGPQKG